VFQEITVSPLLTQDHNVHYADNEQQSGRRNVKYQQKMLSQVDVHHRRFRAKSGWYKM